MSYVSGLNRPSPVTQVVAIGIGIALFFVTGKLAIPTFIPNTTINLQYAVLAVFAVLYGPLVAAVIGGVGHLLIDMTGFGVWASWEIASVIFGLVVGALMINNRVRAGEFTRKTLVRFVLSVIGANAVAWLLFAPLGDIFIHAEPANKVFVQGSFAFISNSITAAVLGSIILAAYARTQTRSGSLVKEQ